MIVLMTREKIGSVGFIGGAMFVAAGSVLVPRADDLANIVEMQEVFGEQAVMLQVSALLIAFGFWATLAGTSAVRRTIDAEGNEWARLGFMFHLVGIALWTVGMSLDISYPAAIVNWRQASPETRDIAYSVMTVLSPQGFGRGLFPLNLIVNWLSFSLLSVGVIISRRPARWVGWVGVAIGVAGVLLGVAMTFTGREVLITGFLMLMACTLLWWLILGITLRRR